jgi:GGDEF domain-containing protein
VVPAGATYRTRLFTAAGVGIGEAIDDLICLYRAVAIPPDAEVLRALALGWVQGRESLPVLSGVRDPMTGLPTIDYLGERMRETYGAAKVAGTPVPQTHCLVVIDVAVDGLDAWQRMARSAAVGRTLDQIFGEGHPMAAMSDGVFAVLCERADTVSQVAQSLRRVVEKNAEILGLGEALRRPTRVWVERLPATHDGALQLLHHLVR